MSESQRTTTAEPIVERLASIDAHRLHGWLLRAARLRHEDLLRSWSAAVSTPSEAGHDLEAFLDWCAAGIELFMREGLPSRRAIDDAAHRVMLAAVLRQHTSISAAAAALETSRRALRAAMKRLGLYESWQQWRASSGPTVAAPPSGPPAAEPSATRGPADGPSEPTDPVSDSAIEPVP